MSLLIKIKAVNNNGGWGKDKLGSCQKGFQKQRGRHLKEINNSSRNLIRPSKVLDKINLQTKLSNSTNHYAYTTSNFRTKM